MQYCKRCGSVCEDALHRCPNCSSNKLRKALDEDFVYLQRADVYTAGRLESLFAENGIECRTEPYGKGRPAPLYDSEVMPTDKSVFVSLKDLPEARDLSAALQREQEEDAPQEEEFAEMPRRKRIVVQALSAIAFILLVMAAVFTADAVAGWLKSLLGLG